MVKPRTVTTPQKSSIMEEIEESWRRMALTEGEQEIIEVEDDLQTEDGSMWSARPFNQQAMLGLMRSLWKPLKGVDIDILSENRVLFTFYSRADRSSNGEMPMEI